MKIKGEKTREYKDVESLSDAMKESLDELVLSLQHFALGVFKTKSYSAGINYWMARAYLDAIVEINRQYGTNYATHIDKIREHFEKPVKD